MIKYLHPGPWPIIICLIVGQKALDKQLKSYTKNSPTGVATSSLDSVAAKMIELMYGDRRAFFICFNQDYLKRARRSDPVDVYATIGHEASHMVRAMRLHLGDLGDEAEAYLVDYIIKEAGLWIKTLKLS